MALKELEEGLRTELFHRNGRKISLNENGRRLHPKAHSLLLLAAEIEKPETEEPEGLLRIAGSPVLGNYILPSCCAAFLQRYPKVRIVLATSALSEAINRDEAMSVDLGLIDAPCNRSSLVAEPIGHDRAVVFAAPSHSLAKRGRVTLAELRAASWCLREMTSLNRTHLLMTLGTPGMDIRFEAHTDEAMKAAVASGLGLGFGSARLIAREVTEGMLVQIETDAVALDRPITLLAPKRVHRRRLSELFAVHVRAWLAAEQPTTQGALIQIGMS
jgi:DNA-binding transcriptional LysR family regulator